MPWKFFPRGTDFDPRANASSVALTSITIRKVPSVASPSNSTGSANVDESYSLDLSTNGTVLITAASAPGALHALTTLSQLFYRTSDGQLYSSLAPVAIRDRPKYAHRGLNLDIARNWLSPRDVERVLDGMALTKLNVLHLHATDAQSWPLEIPSVPELAAKGAYHPSLVWSAGALRGLQRYAWTRGIRTIVEIDAPAHTGAIAYSHPELVVAFNHQPWAQFCNEPACGQVSLKDPAVLEFFDKVYADLLPRVAPYGGGYFHAGGDELNVNTYLLDPLVKSNDSAVLKGLLGPFVEHLHARIRKQGLRPLVWEELIAEWNLTLPTSDVLVQSWLNGSSSLDTITQRGYRALFGDYEHWYLDCGHGGFLDPNASTVGLPGAVVPPPYVDYCTPYKNWRTVLGYDPRANLTDAQVALLEGGEVHLWGELTGAATLDGRLWPRAAAAAEVLWRGPQGEKGVNEDATRRLADWRERAVGVGIRAAQVQMAWCLQNQGSCTA